MADEEVVPVEPAPVAEPTVRVKIMSGNNAGVIVDQPRTVAEVSIATGYAIAVPEEGPPPPVVTRIEPTTAVCGGPDLVLHVYGREFTAKSVILFNGGEEVTVCVSPTELTTGVKPSLAANAVTVPVGVVGAESTYPFTFTAAPQGGTAAAVSSKAAKT